MEPGSPAIPFLLRNAETGIFTQQDRNVGEEENGGKQTPWLAEILLSAACLGSQCRSGGNDRVWVKPLHGERVCEIYSQEDGGQNPPGAL